MKKEIFINSYVKRDGTRVREHYRTIDSDVSYLVDNSAHSGPVFSEYEGNSGKVMYMGASPVLQGGVSMNVGIPPVLSGGVAMDTMKDYSVYKSTTNLANSLKINAHSGNYEEIAQDIKSYAQDLSNKGISVAKAQPVSQYEKYLNNKYKNTGNLFNNTAVVNNGASSSGANSVQKYQEINPVGYEKIEPVGHEEIKPVKHEKIKVEGTTDKKLDDGKWIMPCKGRISSGFGWRNDPKTGVRTYHNGWDLKTDIGTPFKAIADGKVVFAGYADPAGYAHYIVLEHDLGNGKIVTSEYGHISKHYVSYGQKVKQGQVIGATGNEGKSTGPHLHITIREGKYRGTGVDPSIYIQH